MRNARHIIVIALVATAICAERGIAAAPSEQPAAGIAGRLMQRLTVGLRRVLPAARLYEPRRAGLPAAPSSAAGPGMDRPGVCRVCFSPFHFRMPPPVG